MQRKSTLKDFVVYHVHGPEFVVLWWRVDRPHGIAVVGPFRNQTEATKWGRKHYPYCYKVGAITSPEKMELFQEIDKEIEIDREDEEDGSGGTSATA